MPRVTALSLLFFGLLTRLSGQATRDRFTTVEIAKPSDRTIVLKRSFTAPRQKVFDALTKPDQVPQWFQPAQMSLVTYEADVKPGGAFRYVFQRPSGKKIVMSGVYQELDPPHRWTHTEAYDFSPLELLVITALDETRGKTILTQTIQYPSKEDRDSDFDSVASSSAELYTKLDRYLEAFK